MKYIGIDYGTKKTGIAVSDDGGVMAFPRDTVPTEKLYSYLNELLRESDAVEEVAAFIVGLPQSGTGQANDHQQRTEQFAKELEERFALSVILVNEYASTQAVRATEAHITGYDARRAMKTPRHGHKVPPRDAGAAAIILQRYLDSRQSD